MKKLIQLLVVIFFALTIVSCSKDDNTTPPATTTDTTQQKVFREFWEIYNRHYPLMHRKNINWQSVFDANFPMITSTTTDVQLFTILQGIMTQTIRDGHTDLTFNSQSASYTPDSNSEITTTVQTITDTKVDYLGGSSSNDYISYGTLRSDATIGYIKSKTFEPVNTGSGEFAVYQAVVDAALTALRDKRGIIIDVRTNGGGQLMYATYLAGRFFSNDNITLQRKRYKTTTGDTEASLSGWVLTAADDFSGYPDSRAAEGGMVGATFSDENRVAKSGTFQFTNKVAVLTSRGTASSGEFFTATMKSQSHVRTIGNITFGIFAGSDTFTLREGDGNWRTRVSVHDVEIMYNGSFQSFEGIGITPDDLLLPTAADVAASRDVHIDKGVEYINN